MRKTVLITGASGFIGKCLIDEALSRDYDIYTFVRKSSNIKQLQNKPITILTVDFSDYSSIIESLRNLPKIDFILHTAGVTKAYDEEDYIYGNEHLTQTFINALIHCNYKPKLFVYFSSLAAWGPGNSETFAPINNDCIPSPITSYGKSKLKAEKIVRNQTSFPYIVLRPTAVYGPAEKDFFQTITLINKHLNFNLGFHNQYFTFIHVYDLVKVSFDVLESEICNKSYFVSDGNIYTKKDFGMLVAKHLNKKVFHITVPVVFVKIIAYILESYLLFFKKPAPVLNYEKVDELCAKNWICDCSTIANDIGFKAKYNLNEGIKQTIDWYKKEEWLQ